MTLLIYVRAPTLDEWNSDAFTWLSLTSESLTWDPTTTIYSDQEAAMTDYSGNVVRCAAVRGRIFPCGGQWGCAVARHLVVLIPLEVAAEEIAVGRVCVCWRSECPQTQAA